MSRPGTAPYVGSCRECGVVNGHSISCRVDLIVEGITRGLRREGYILIEAFRHAELVETLTAVRAYYFLANPTKLSEAQVCDMVCGTLGKIEGDAVCAMPTVVTGERPLQSVGDHALPPSGLSPCGSQAKPAAAIASELPDPDDIAMQIEGFFAEATNNACTCGSDPEAWCHYCSAWAAAHKKTVQLLREAQDQSL